MNGSFVVSDEVRLALAPARVYGELVLIDTGWRAVLARLAFAALLLGVCLAITATGRVTMLDVLELSIAWSYPLGIQLIAATTLIVGASRRVTTATAYDLVLAAHVPWSLWLLANTAFAFITGNVDLEWMLVLSVIPAAWTATILSAFCRVVLGMERAQARRRVMAHQAVIWSFVVVYVVVTSALWPRFLNEIGQ